MDKTAIIIIIAVIFAGVVFWAFQSGIFQKQPAVNPPALSGIVLFFGDGCPHCKTVDDFIKENKIDQKVQFTLLEVPFGTKTSPQLQANAMAAIQKAQECKIDVANGMSIPFLWNEKTNSCLMGDQPIINFFKNLSR